MSVYTLSSPWANDRSTNPDNTYFTVAAWTNVALQSHGSVCDENATTISSSNPCAKAFDGILISSSYWTTTNPGVGSWLKVRKNEKEDKQTCQHTFNTYDVEARVVVRGTYVNTMTGDALASGVLCRLASMGLTVYNGNAFAFIESEPGHLTVD